ncbi:MAG: glycosyltransferase [Patescibacteria group bacterium]|nr:glycosyltransferase [Patescibacteria group bacterium]
MNDKKIVIYSHNGHNSRRGNWDEELVNYLVNRNYGDILHCRFPFGKDSLKSIRLFLHQNNTLKIRESWIKFDSPEIISYIKDFFYGFFYGFIYFKNIDLFVGTNNLLTFVGLFFKKLGLVKKVAYVVIDYTPVRFDNKLIDSVYYFLDKIACYHSDVVWPLNVKMLEGREKDGRIDLRRVNFKEAPFGNNSMSFNNEAGKNHDRHKIVYLGNILKNKGCELFVPTVKALLDSGLTDFKMEVIGNGDVDYLAQAINTNNLGGYFNLRGRIENQDEINGILLRCGIAIAPYYPADENSYSYYADPGKVKIYLGCGLPIVITDVPPIAKDIVANQAGLIAGYDAGDFADKILEISENYELYRANAIKFGKLFNWNIIFEELFKDIKI